MDKLNKLAQVHCLNLLTDRLRDYQQDLTGLQQSANEENRSSMGDKYETGRSMAQQEIEKLQARTEELNKLYKVLQNLKPPSGAKAGMGSLVICDSGRYFIAVSLGLLQSQDLSFIAVSPATPLAGKLMGRTAGDQIDLNGRTHRILEVIN